MTSLFANKKLITFSLIEFYPRKLKISTEPLPHNSNSRKIKVPSAQIYIIYIDIFTYIFISFTLYHAVKLISPFIVL